MYPYRKEVAFRTGYDDLRPYLFGDKKMAHKFCSTCGSSVIIDFHDGPCGVNGGDRLAINVGFGDIQRQSADQDESGSHVARYPTRQVQSRRRRKNEEGRF